MNTVAIVLSAVCLYQLIFVRMAKSNWFTIKARFMVVYLGYALIHWYVVYLACTTGITVFSVIYGLTNLQWLWNTHEDWKAGIPGHMRSDYTPLGAAEVESDL